MTSKIFAGIEGGGTKFICAVADANNHILAETRIATTTPDETLGRCADFLLAAQHEHGALSALGIACFGPLDPRPASPTFGHILVTPKAGWGNTDVVGYFRNHLAATLPIGFDTDVNGAVLAEARWGAGQGLSDLLYLTIGTGIGGGALVNGSLLHGYAQPEMGHIRLPHDRERDPFNGVCPFHGDCFEGLASGPAIAARWGKPAEDLPPEHPGWELEAGYIAGALHNNVVTLAPERIILGGGVMKHRALFAPIRANLLRSLAGYIQVPTVVERMDDYVVPSGLQGKAGLYGALALAQLADGG